MTQNVPLDDGDNAVEGFFDAIQEMLSGAAENLEVDLLNPTTVVVRAGVGDKQVSVSIGGQYRWITANRTRAHPGGAAGVYDLSVTSADNAVEAGIPAGGDSSFDLAITATGVAPSSVARYRVVRRIVWDGTRIAGVFRMQNEPHGELAIGDLAFTMRSGDLGPYFRVADGRSGSTGGMATADFPQLAVVLGQTGQTWITLPDWRGFTVAGAIDGGTAAGAGPNDNTRLQLVRGAAAGEVLHKLTTGEMPQHAHGHNIANPVYFETGGGSGRDMPGSGNGRSGFAFLNIGNAGGDGSHENRQPTRAANVMIRVL